MRCYFMSNGHIGAVEELGDALSDEEAVAQATTLFRQQSPGKYDAFEVWHRTRYLYRWPPDEDAPLSPLPVASPT